MLKLAINISLAVQMLAFAEGLLLAERSGIDRQLAADVMTESPIGSPMLKARAPLVLDLPDEAWFDIGLMQKDIALALDAARRLAVPLPSAAAADQMLTVARARATSNATWRRSSRCWPTRRPTVAEHDHVPGRASWIPSVPAPAPRMGRFRP